MNESSKTMANQLKDREEIPEYCIKQIPANDCSNDIGSDDVFDNDEFSVYLASSDHSPYQDNSSHISIFREKVFKTPPPRKRSNQNIGFSNSSSKRHRSRIFPVASKFSELQSPQKHDQATLTRSVGTSTMSPVNITVSKRSELQSPQKYDQPTLTISVGTSTMSPVNMSRFPLKRKGENPPVDDVPSKRRREHKLSKSSYDSKVNKLIGEDIKLQEGLELAKQHNLIIYKYTF